MPERETHAFPIRSMTVVLLSQEQVLKNFRKAHGRRYDYSRVKYRGSQLKVKIICRKHGPFEQIAAHHASGYGCAPCGRESKGRESRMSQREVLKQFAKAHGKTYDYSLVKYTTSDTPVTIICKAHGRFKQKPGAHKVGIGCHKCGLEAIGKANRRKEMPLKDWVKRLQTIHGNTYDYSKLKNGVIVCRTHGHFSMTPWRHAAGYGCPSCGNARTGDARRLPTREVIKRFRAVHGNHYDYSLTEYTKYNSLVSIICPDHGSFEVTPVAHWSGSTCPQCRGPKTYSLVACKALDAIAKHLKIKIEHRGNGKEKFVKFTRMRTRRRSFARLDGYCESSNFAFEFHGDAFHGNPDVFSPRDVCNGFDKKTARALLTETLTKERRIKQEGYTLFSLWGSTYRDPSAFRKWLKGAEIAMKKKTSYDLIAQGYV